MADLSVWRYLRSLKAKSVNIKINVKIIILTGIVPDDLNLLKIFFSCFNALFLLECHYPGISS